MKALLVATALASAALPLGAQEDSLLDFAIRQALDPGYEFRPVICIGIREGEGAMRDYAEETRKVVEVEGSEFAGHSECEKSARGSFHRATGRPATVLEIGLSDTAGVFTIGFHLHGLYAGASECSAEFGDGGWRLRECRELWVS